MNGEESEQPELGIFLEEEPSFVCANEAEKAL